MWKGILRKTDVEKNKNTNKITINRKMKKLMLMSLAALISLSAGAQEKKDGENKNKPVFTTIKENKITSIKDQNRSGTCWDYSTLSYFEAEILKKTGKT